MSKSRGKSHSHQPDRNCGRLHSSPLDRTFSSTSSSDLCHQLDNLDEEDEGEEETGVDINRMGHALTQTHLTQPGFPGLIWPSKKFERKVPHGRTMDTSECDEDNHMVGHLLLDDEDFSVDMPSDLPSGLIDAEGDLIGSIRLGEEDEFEHSQSTNHNGADNNLLLLDRDGNCVDGSGDGDGHQDRLRSLSVISNGRVFTHGRGYHLHNHCHRHHVHQGVGRDNSTGAQSNSSTSTITQHYYPEGGFGWVVLVTALLSHVLMCGVQLSAGLIVAAICKQFGSNNVRVEAGWLGACSVGISLFLSPIWVSICKRKSTRLTAVFGGLVAALGCLFTSFATQLHQIFFSYATILGVGVGLTRDASSLMVGQYFKRKRDMVEIIMVAASGLGILVMSILIDVAIKSFGWRLGLQIITGCLFICFFLGTCYRSASLYHPQRRAILHLKNQKRKVKDKEKRDDKPPFLDCSCLKSKTVQILLLSSALTAFGTYTPIFYLAIDHENSSDPLSTVPEVNMSLLYIYVGLAWILGSIVFGTLVIQKSKECRISKQYLCQAAGIICGISIVTFTIVKGQSGLLIFCCIYGFSLGGYNYALKVYTYDRVRARHFPRAWSFIQSSQGIPLFLGVPITGYLNDYFPGWRAGYYLSAFSVVLGSTFLFLADVRKRRLSRRKSQNSSTKTCETAEKSGSTAVTTTSTSISKFQRLSFAFPIDQIYPESSKTDDTKNCVVVGTNDQEDQQEEQEDDGSILVKELTCISEEAFADMDLQDMYYEEWDDFFAGEESDISSCNKVEDCLVSDFQPDYPVATILQSQLQPKSMLKTESQGRRKYHKFSRNGLHAGILGGTAAAVASMACRLPLTIQEAPDDDDDDDDEIPRLLPTSFHPSVPPVDEIGCCSQDCTTADSAL